MTKKRNIILLAGLVALSSFFILEKSSQPKSISRSTPAKSLRLVGNVISLIRDDYVDPPDPSDTMEGAFRGLVNNLDIRSSYLDGETIDTLQRLKSGPLPETGMLLYKKFGAFPVVIGVKPGSPAESAGIKLGDSISMIENRSTLMMSMTEANLRLYGKDENPVKLTFLKTEGQEELQVDRLLENPAALSYSPAEGTNGILKLNHIFSPLVDEIRSRVLSVLDDPSRALILDVRDCYDGDYEEARRLINLFLQAEPAGFFEKRGGGLEEIDCPADPDHPDLPLIIWTNQATIGPAEMIAGVLKDHQRAKLVGTPTLGLAAKQRFFPLEDGSGVLLTVSVFQLSADNKLWLEGVKPDRKIESDDMNAAFLLDESRKLLR